LFLQVNTTDEVKVETLELPGREPETFELRARFFALRAHGYLIFLLPDTDQELFHASGAFELKISGDDGMELLFMTFDY